MANERNTGERLTATVGERIEDDARHGERAGVDRAQAVVEDLREAGWSEPGPRAAGAGAPRAEGAAERSRGAARAAPPAPRRRRARIGWAVAAGVGMWIVAGMIGRTLRR